MKFVKMAVVIAFVLALTAFGAAEIKEIRERDTSKPVITSDRDVLEIPCDYTQEQLVEGLSASDEKDGDLTDKILVGNFSRFIEKGVSNVTYVVFDSSNQAATLTRKVKFTDYHSPRFTLSEPLIFQNGQGDYEKLLGRIGVLDQLDQKVSEWMTRTDYNVNFQKAGQYYITMETSNKYGDTSSAQLPVHIVEEGTQRVNIVLSSNIVYLNVGDSISPMDYVSSVSDKRGNTLGTESVTTESTVDSQTPGTYEVHYYAEDGNGSIGETWLTVVVQE